MQIIRYILIFTVPLYFLITWCRNKLYDWGILKSVSFDLPVICVGNLNVGGTGKTPTIEYLIELLKDNYRIATLSRGFKRKSRGFILAGKDASPELIGDEPYQFLSKYQDIHVAVDSNRRRGIENLTVGTFELPEVILLDDAFQHRRVRAGLNILLTAYDHLYINDILLPTGNLREPRSGANRAEIIIVTKCPGNLSEEDKQKTINQLNPKANQKSNNL